MAGEGETDYFGPGGYKSYLFRTLPGASINPATDAFVGSEKNIHYHTRMNNSGRVVDGYTPVLCRGDAYTKIADLIPPGWHVEGALSINNRQQIAASGYAIGAPYGGTLLLTPLPPVYKQDDSAWGGENTLNSPSLNRMKDTGCFVTAAAMILNSLGHEINPGQLNAFLRPLDNPATGDVHLTPDWFPAAAFYGQTDGVDGPPVRFRNTNATATTREAITRQIKSLLEEYGPVVLRVPSPRTGRQYYPSKVHAIVAYAVEGEDILIRDPGHTYLPEEEALSPYSRVTLDDYVSYVNTKVTEPQYRLSSEYAWLDGKDLSYSEVLTFSSEPVGTGNGNSPIEFILTDGQGRRLGYDPIEGISFNEIPGSFYGRDSFVASAEEDNGPPPSDYPPIHFEIGDLVFGTYGVEVFGLATGPWSIDFGVSDAAGPHVWNMVGSGVASAGSYQQFSFQHVPEPSILTLLSMAVFAFLAYAWKTRGHR